MGAGSDLGPRGYKPAMTSDSTPEVPLPPEVEEVLDGEEDGEAREGFVDRLRHAQVGTDDPNIIGDPGPLDIPPGAEGDTAILYPDATGVDHVER